MYLEGILISSIQPKTNRCVDLISIARVRSSSLGEEVEVLSYIAEDT